METFKAKWKAISPVGHLIVALFLIITSLFLVIPFWVDIMLEALCEDHTECQTVILLTGYQQTVIGFGVIIIAPVLGSISDEYGRKPIFRILFFAAIVPSVLLAYNRTTLFVYIWFALNLLLGIVREGALLPTTLAYVADVVDERHRAAAVGFSMAAITGGTLCGTGMSFFFEVDYHAFWTAAGFQCVAAIYLQLFLKESNPRVLQLPADLSKTELATKLISKPVWARQSSSILEAAKFVWRSRRLRTIALVDFMNSFSCAGSICFLLYYLKAAFGFGKEEYAFFVILWSISAIVGQVFFYPVMANILGERGVLWISLVGTGGQSFLYSFGSGNWVPYVAAAAGVFPSLFQPAAGTMVSRGLHHDQQGKVQGFMSSIRAVASIIAPLLLTPLAAISLVDNAPVHMKGLVFLVCGVASVVAFLISCGVPSGPVKPTEGIQEPFLLDHNVDVQANPQDGFAANAHSGLHDPINSA